jgi:hypothetical protein
VQQHAIIAERFAMTSIIWLPTLSEQAKERHYHKRSVVLCCIVPINPLIQGTMRHNHLQRCRQKRIQRQVDGEHYTFN